MDLLKLQPEYYSKPFRIASLRELKEVAVNDIGEPLVNVFQYIPPEQIIPMLNDTSDEFGMKNMRLRKGVCEKLQTIAHLLLTMGLKLIVADGWRHPTIQKRYFTSYYEKLMAEKIWSSNEELMEAVHQLVAVPEVAGHPTGGAVDLWLKDAISGTPIDMGSPIWDFDHPHLIPTFAEKISPKQQMSRIILRTALLEEGFIPFDGEWWHFSFGDREWGALTGNPAIYEPILGSP